MENEIRTKKQSPQWDVLTVIGHHSLLLILLGVFLTTVVPLIGPFLGEIGGTLPWALQKLIDLSFMATIPAGIAAICFLWADAKIYSMLLNRHGKRAATKWALIAGILISLGMMLFFFLFTKAMTAILAMQGRSV